MTNFIRVLCLSFCLMACSNCTRDRLKVVTVAEIEDGGTGTTPDTSPTSTPACRIVRQVNLGPGVALYSATRGDAGFAVNWQTDEGMRVQTFGLTGEQLHQSAVPHSGDYTDWSKLAFGPDYGYTISFEWKPYYYWGIHQLNDAAATEASADGMEARMIHEIVYTGQKFLTLFATNTSRDNEHTGIYYVRELQGVQQKQLHRLEFNGQVSTRAAGLTVNGAGEVVFAASHLDTTGAVTINLVTVKSDGQTEQVLLFQAPEPAGVTPADFRVYPHKVFTTMGGYAVFWEEYLASEETTFHLTYVSAGRLVQDHILPKGIVDLAPTGGGFVAPAYRRAANQHVATMLLQLDASGKVLASYELDVEVDSYRPTATVATVGENVVVNYDHIANNATKAAFLSCKL